jgi:transposase
MTKGTLRICVIMCSRHRTRERPWDGLLTGSLSVFLCFHGPQPDNLSSHNKAALRRAIENAGATVLFLPPYSPDLNPIEQPFAKLKALLRAKALRTVDAL